MNIDISQQKYAKNLSASINYQISQTITRISEEILKAFIVNEAPFYFKANQFKISAYKITQ